VAQSKEQAKYIATIGSQYSEAAYVNSLDADEGKARRPAHAVQEVPPDDFDTKDGDFGLVRALDVLGYGGDVQKAAANPRGQKMADSELTGEKSDRFTGKDKAGPAKTGTASSASSSGSA